ncbi:MAG: HemK/PrmC family methyltransferase [Patescibacteria group bacterium]
MTIRKLIKWSSKDIGWFDSEYLMARVLGKTREFVVANPNTKVPVHRRLFFKRHVNRRKKGIPAAYIVKRQEFYGFSFFVNKHVMVPRPGTEMLVEGALSALSNELNRNYLIIDVGTGSGCISIAIAKSIQQFFVKQDMPIYATEISRRALRVAKINAKRHKVNIHFLHGDLLKPFTKNLTMGQLNDKSIIITANLPYLIKKIVEKENPPRREPMVALLGGQNGLELYEKLLGQMKLLAAGRQLSIVAFFEINHNQAGPIKKMAQLRLPDSNISFKQDLNGDLRVVCIKQE